MQFPTISKLVKRAAFHNRRNRECLFSFEIYDSIPTKYVRFGRDVFVYFNENKHSLYSLK